MKSFSLLKYRSQNAAVNGFPVKSRRFARLFFVLGLFLTVTVSSAQDQNVLVLTRGGGVTGHTTVYIVKRDGQVLRSIGTDPARDPADFSEAAKLGKCKTRRYFRKTCALMEENSFNHPGNMYSSLLLRQDGKQSELVWGDPQYEVSEKVQAWFKKMQSKLGRLTFEEVRR